VTDAHLPKAEARRLYEDVTPPTAHEIDSAGSSESTEPRSRRERPTSASAAVAQITGKD
jgi:hypothetical protein